MSEKDILSLNDCTLCPRECHADRTTKYGYCGCDFNIYIARAAAHMWEEPCISGKSGSGAVFFCGCNLRCIFCQNKEISRFNKGFAGRYKSYTKDELCDIFLRLEDAGLNNINLVTATHYIPQVIAAIGQAKDKGLKIPIVYNSSGYEKKEAIKRLEGLVDVYLPDFKYISTDLSEKFSKAPDYGKYAKEAIDEMFRQQSKLVFSDKGLIKKGVIIRHLVLPGHTKESIGVLDYLYEKYKDNVYISIMSQYTPVSLIPEYKELNRKLTRREYDKVLNHALDLGIKNAYIQEGKVAKESFIPTFDGHII